MNLSFTVLAAALLLHPASELSKTHHYDIRCAYPQTQTGRQAETAARSDECKAQIQVCAVDDCQHTMKLQCGDDSIFDGSMDVGKDGNRIVLNGVPSQDAPSAPRIIIGPAKTPPRPGKPILADSWLNLTLEDGGEILGECSVVARTLLKSADME